MRASALQVLVTAMRRDENFTVPDQRAVELAHRLVASGPKACAVSASECHEISNALLAVHDQQGPGSIGLVALYRHAEALLDLAMTWEAISDAAAIGITFGEKLLLVSMNSKLAAVHAATEINENPATPSVPDLESALGALPNWDLQQMTKQRNALLQQTVERAAALRRMTLENNRMRPVVEAAERWYDEGPCYAGIGAAVDAYRASKEGP